MVAKPLQCRFAIVTGALRIMGGALPKMLGGERAAVVVHDRGEKAIGGAVAGESTQ